MIYHKYKNGEISKETFLIELCNLFENEQVNSIEKFNLENFLNEIGMPMDLFLILYKEKELLVQNPNCLICKYSKCSIGHHKSCSVASKVKVNEHGLKNGWAFHPFDFDPIWIEYCNSFDKK